MTDLFRWCFYFCFLLGAVGWIGFWIERGANSQLRADLEAHRAAIELLKSRLKRAEENLLAGGRELLCEPENKYDES